MNLNQQAFGFVTWAWVTDDIKKDLISSSRALIFLEWNKGTELFFNDFVAPWGGGRNILNDMTKNVFPKEKAFSVSRDEKGNVKKVLRWVGKLFHLEQGNSRDRKKPQRWVSKKEVE